MMTHRLTVHWRLDAVHVRTGKAARKCEGIVVMPTIG